MPRLHDRGERGVRRVASLNLGHRMHDQLVATESLSVKGREQSGPGPSELQTKGIKASLNSGIPRGVCGSPCWQFCVI